MSRERCSFFLSFLSFCSKKKGGVGLSYESDQGQCPVGAGTERLDMMLDDTRWDVSTAFSDHAIALESLAKMDTLGLLS